MDRWFHVNVSNNNLQLVDYYMNLYTAAKDGYGYDNANVVWSDEELAQYFTVGFYTDKETNYELYFSCGTPYGFSDSQLHPEMSIMIDDVKVFKGPAYYTFNKETLEYGSIYTNKECYYFGEHAVIGYEENDGYTLKAFYIDGNRTSFDHGFQRKQLMVS